MPMLDRDNQARFLNLHLGKDTREELQPLIEQVKQEMKTKPFILKALQLYKDHPELFQD